MKLSDLVSLALAGKLTVQHGQRGQSVVIESLATIGTSDLDALTAEAYNQDALSSELPWEQGLRQVKNEIARQKAI